MTFLERLQILKINLSFQYNTSRIEKDVVLIIDISKKIYYSLIVQCTPDDGECYIIAGCKLYLKVHDTH